MGNKIFGILVTIAFFVLVAFVGYRLYQEQSTTEASAPPAAEESEKAAAPEPDADTGEETAEATDGADEGTSASQDETAKEGAGEEPLADESEQAAGETSGEGQDKAEENSAEGNSAEGNSADVPSFDVVRVEQSGEGVIAGRAEPGWGVEIQSNGDSIAKTKADPAGQWSLVLDKPLSGGEHALTILATSPDGDRSISSQQTVLVSMGDEQSDKTVVALREPGKATEILQESAGDESGATGESASSEEKMAAADMGDESGTGQEPMAGDESMAGNEPAAGAADDEEPSASASDDTTAGDEEDTAASNSAASDESAGSDESASSDESVPPVASKYDEEEGEGGQDASSGDTVEAKPAGDDTPQPPQPPLRIKTVDYEDSGEDSGQLIVSGNSTKPGTELVLYLDGEVIGRGETGEDGDWKIEATTHLEPGIRTLQVDMIDPSKDLILGRAAVRMQRQEPEQQMAAAQSEAGAESSSETSEAGSDGSAPAGEESAAGAEPPDPDRAPGEEIPDPDRAPGEEIPDPDRSPGDMASAEPETQPGAQQQDSGPKVYTVRRGDTLWTIAEEYFGGGWRYTMIFKDNRGKIRNPHWIYPNQEFEIRER